MVADRSHLAEAVGIVHREIERIDRLGRRFRADSDETVSIPSGGLATSGIAVRRWKLGDHLVHHIIDPVTGLPAAVTWRAVSVAAATCVEANAAATASLVKGADAERWLSALRLPARLVGIDHVIRYTPEWPEEVSEALEPSASTR